MNKDEHDNEDALVALASKLSAESHDNELVGVIAFTALAARLMSYSDETTSRAISDAEATINALLDLWLDDHDLVDFAGTAE
jgi:hypothetical protein